MDMPVRCKKRADVCGCICLRQGRGLLAELWLCGFRGTAFPLCFPLAKGLKKRYIACPCAICFRARGKTRGRPAMILPDYAAFHEVAVMKKDIHPKVFNATITCACGNEEKVLSTKGEQVNVEVCSACHPFFTGKQRFLDTAGRIDRFRKKYAKFEQK